MSARSRTRQIMTVRRVVLASAVAMALIGLVGPASTAAAQDRAPSAVAVAEGHRLRGEFSEAVRVLRAHIAVAPDDGEAARLLAETLYWLGDIPAARQAYDAALARFPQDTLVRLQYARMLVETGETGAARPLLLEIRNSASAAGAESLLGTIAYWEGDLARAVRHFESALRLDPAHADALRQLDEIRAATSPWLRIGGTARRDDQPLDRLAGGIEAGWFATPHTPVTARFDTLRFETDEATRELWLGEVEVRHGSPRGIEIAAAVGAVSAPDGGREATARGRLAARPSPEVAIGVEVARAPYWWTTSSLDVSVLPTTTRVFASVSGRGFDGEAAFERHAFDDDNAVTSAHAWLLVPLARRERRLLQAGYAFTVEDSKASRFELAHPGPLLGPAGSALDTRGRYVPYYTPEQRRTHAVLGAVAAGTRGGAWLRLSGSFAVRTTELAPEFVAAGGGITRVFVPRESHPWEARASLDVPIHDRLLLTVHGEAGRKAFYDWQRAAVSLTYRFRGRAGSASPGGR